MMVPLIFLFLATTAVARLVRDGTDCGLCHSVLGSFTRESNREVMLSTIGSACDDLSTYPNEACRQLIDDNGSDIATYLQEVTAPKGACVAIGMCPAVNHRGGQDNTQQKYSIVNNQIKPNRNAMAPPHIGLKYSRSKCLSCTRTVGLMDGAITKSVSRQISAFHVEECEQYPTLSLDQCLAVGDRYVTYLLETTKLSPEIICTTVGLCRKKQLMRSVKDANQFDIGCAICDIAMAAVTDPITDPTYRAAIQNALDTACSFIPFIGARCTVIVDNVSQLIFAAIDAGIASQDVCAAIGVCPPKV